LAIAASLLNGRGKFTARQLPTRQRSSLKKNFGPRLQLAVMFFRGAVFAAKHDGVLNSKKLEVLLRNLNSQLRRKFPEVGNFRLLQDNDPVQNSKATKAVMAKMGWMDNTVTLARSATGREKFTPTYSPDLSPVDGSLFGWFQTELHRILHRGASIPKSQRAFDALALRTLKGGKCAGATQRFVEGFRKRFQAVVHGKGEMLC